LLLDRSESTTILGGTLVLSGIADDDAALGGVIIIAERRTVPSNVARAIRPPPRHPVLR
jgi:hypothetical protein